MKIFINGDTLEIAQAEKLSAVLPRPDPTAPYAVALNGDFIARNEYDMRTLKDGDEIDIVSPVGGG